MTTYAKGTNVRDIQFADRSTKMHFNCKHHPEIQYRTKEWGASQCFPANEHTRWAEFGTEPMECDHKFRDDVWVLTEDYTNDEVSEAKWGGPKSSKKEL